MCVCMWDGVGGRRWERESQTNGPTVLLYCKHVPLGIGIKKKGQLAAGAQQGVPLATSPP